MERSFKITLSRKVKGTELCVHVLKADASILCGRHCNHVLNGSFVVTETTCMMIFETAIHCRCHGYRTHSETVHRRAKIG